LDEGAEINGRDPSELRIYFNVMGYIETRPGGMRPKNPGVFWGNIDWWIEKLSSLADSGVSGFTYWPVAGDVGEQFRLFAEEIVFQVRQNVSGMATR
jgi:hypothetical protein